MDPQKQLQSLGMAPAEAQKAADAMAAKGLSLTDLLTALPEILDLAERFGSLFKKLWKKPTP